MKLSGTKIQLMSDLILTSFFIITCHNGSKKWDCSSLFSSHTIKEIFLIFLISWCITRVIHINVNKNNLYKLVIIISLFSCLWLHITYWLCRGRAGPWETIFRRKMSNESFSTNENEEQIWNDQSEAEKRFQVSPFSSRRLR